MGRKKSPDAKSGRYELRITADWLERVKRQAERFGVSVPSYIREATIKRLEADEKSESAKDKNDS